MKDPMSNKRPTYLVTGAGGFVGAALAKRLLEAGARVVCLVRDGQSPIGCEEVRGGLESPEDCRRLVMKARPDAVFHLAAQAKVGYAKVNRLETLESNVRGTYNLLEAVQQCAPFAKVVVASSDKAYGEMKFRSLESGVQEPYRETDPLEGHGIYDVSKTCTDLIAQAYAQSCGLDTCIIRAGNIYGPGDTDLSRLVPSLCDDLSSGRQPVVRSDGTPVRDFLYIDDAVDAYLKAAMLMTLHDEQRFVGMPFNVAGGTPCTVLELAERLSSIHRGMGGNGLTTPMVMGERTQEIHEQRLDWTRARYVLGWEPKVPLNEGLKRTLLWWNEGRRPRRRNR